jgi:hypothetical protein
MLLLRKQLTKSDSVIKCIALIDKTWCCELLARFHNLKKLNKFIIVTVGNRVALAHGGTQGGTFKCQ